MTDEQSLPGDPNQPLRHRVFFQAASEMPENSPAYAMMIAGLLVIRLLDKYPEPKPDTDEWNDRRRQEFTAVEDHIALVADTPVRWSLANLTEAVSRFSRGGSDSRTSHLIAYAQFLEDASQWLPAADVYLTAVELIESSKANADLLPLCLDRSVHCIRQAKQFVRAHELLSRGIEIATQQRDTATQLRDNVAIAAAQFWLVRMQIAMGMLSGEMLEHSYEWKDAAAIYEGTIDLIKTRPLEKPLLLPAYERAAFCCRQAGEIDRGEALLDDAFAVALELHDIRWSLYLRISSAVVERQKGDLPEAEDQLDTIIGDAELANETEMVARAMHERGLVAYERKQAATSVEFCYAAAQRYADPKMMRRALVDAAVALADLGYLHHARRLCQFVRRAPDDGLESRALAGVNLMRYEALADHRPTFESLRVELSTEHMSGRLLAHYHLFVGQSLLHFGDKPGARRAFEQAIAIAGRHHVNKLLVETERMLAATDDRPVVWKETRHSPALAAMLDDIDAQRGLFAEATTT